MAEEPTRTQGSGGPSRARARSPPQAGLGCLKACQVPPNQGSSEADLGCATILSLDPHWAWVQPSGNGPGQVYKWMETSRDLGTSAPVSSRTKPESCTSGVSLTCSRTAGLMSQVVAPHGRWPQSWATQHSHTWTSPLPSLTTSPPEKGGQESDLYGTPSVRQAPAQTRKLRCSLRL